MPSLLLSPAEIDRRTDRLARARAAVRASKRKAKERAQRLAAQRAAIEHERAAADEDRARYRAEKARHAARLADSPAMREARVAYAHAEAERSVQGKAGRPRMKPMSNLTRDPANALVGALGHYEGV